MGWRNMTTQLWSTRTYISRNVPYLYKTECNVNDSFFVIWFAFVLYSRSWPRSKISRVNRYHCNVRPNYTTLQQMLHMINKNNIIEVIGIHI